MQHMKIKSFLFAVVAAMLLAVPFARAAEREIVLVDMERAFNEFYKAKLADAELKKRADEYSEEHKGKVETYKKLQEEIAALQEDVMNNALSEAARSDKRNEMEEKLLERSSMERDIQRLDESAKKDLSDQMRRMNRRITEEMMKIVEDYAKTRGYPVVLDSSLRGMNGTPFILYTDGKIDITDDIINALNKGKPDGVTEDSAK